MPGPVIVGQSVTYYQGWDFVVEVAGVTVGGFTDCEGLEKDHKVVIQQVGGNPGIADVSNSTTIPKPITLKRGGSNNLDLNTWSENVEANVRDIRDVSVVQQYKGVPVVRYNCTGCALTNYKPGTFARSEEEKNLIEEITFQPTKWKRVLA